MLKSFASLSLIEESSIATQYLTTWSTSVLGKVDLLGFQQQKSHSCFCHLSALIFISVISFCSHYTLFFLQFLFLLSFLLLRYCSVVTISSVSSSSYPVFHLLIFFFFSCLLLLSCFLPSANPICSGTNRKSIEKDAESLMLCWLMCVCCGT